VKQADEHQQNENMNNAAEGAATKLPFVDLAPIIEGQTALETPSVAQVLANGRCLFYRGRLNELHGEPGEGKTNVLIAASNAVLAAGGSVLFIDPEDTPSGFVRRALGLGGDAEALRTRCFYLHNPTPDEISLAQTWAAEHAPDLVVIDGLAEALAAEGLNEDVAGDVLQFSRDRLRPFADKGAAVVIADHVTKSSEGRGRWSRGSGAKLGRYDGLVLGVELGKAYTPTQDGYVKLRIQKDRNGGAGARGATLAEVHFEPAGAHTTVSFISPESGENWRPTAIMEKVISHLQTFGQDTKSRVCGEIGSKRDTVLQAIKFLIDDGRITCTTKGSSHILALAAERAVPPFQTSSPSVPGTGQNVGQPVPKCSPPTGGTGNGNDAAENRAHNRKETSAAAPARPVSTTKAMPLTAEDFDNDPGIKAALERFCATLEPQTP
jgi:hypothetical protein